MAARGSVGTGYIDIVPRLGSDWGRELTRRMQEGAGPAGDQSGQDAGGRFFSGFLARFREGPFRALGGTIGKGIAAGAAAAGGLGIGKLLADAVSGASDMNETVSKVGVVFGTAAAGVLEFGRTAAAALGQSRQQALEATGTIGNLFVSMGLGQKQAADMSVSMVKLATDFASFNNASPEEALDAIKAALIGENDPIQRFGVLLNAASIQAEALRLGLAKTKNEITPAVQAQAAYSLILAQSTTAQGDFARTSGGLANQQRILKAEFLDLSAKAGAIFLPFVTRAVSGLAGFLGVVPRVASALSGTLRPAFAGLAGLGGLGDIGSGIATKVMPGLKSFGDFITGSLWPTLKNLAAIFARLWVDIRPLAVVVGGVLLLAFRAVGAVLTNVIGPILSGLSGFIRSNQTALTALAIAVGVATLLFNVQAITIAALTLASRAYAAAMALVRGAMAAVRTAALLMNAAFLANPIGIVIAALIALAAGFAYLWTHSEKFRNFWKALWDGIKNVTMAVVHAVLGFFESIGQGISRFISWGIGFVRKWWPVLLAPMTMGLSLLVGFVLRHWDSIKSAFSTAINWLGGFVGKWWPFILGVMTGGIGLAVGMIIRHWDSIKLAFSGPIDWIKGVVSRGIGAVKSAFEGGLRSMETVANTIWGHIKAAFSNPIDFIKGLIRGFDHIVNNITGAIGLGRPLPEKFARGGRLPGYGGGDRRLIFAEDGEAVVPKHLVGEMAPWARARGIPGFEGGGLLGAVGHAFAHPLDTIKGAGDWVLDKAAHLLREGAAAALSAALAGPRGLLHSFLGRALPWRMPAAATDRGLTGIIDWIRGKESAGGAGPVGGGGAARWAGVFTQALRQAGQPASWLALGLRRLNQESGGAANAINKWDANWLAGHPSVGLMQVVAGTFARYAGPYRNTGPFLYGVSVDPMANIYSSIMYTKGRYGSLSAWGRPGGYDTGGGKPWPSGTVGVNTSGETEYVWRRSQLRAGGRRDVHVHFHGGTFVGTDKTRFGREMRDILRNSLRGDGKTDTANSL